MQQQIAQFQLLGQLARGGMGEVYRAHDLHLNRPVALEILSNRVALDPERREWFLREARTRAAVSHPNLATVYQVAQADSRIFIAMELVQGQTLESWLTTHTPGIEQALSIARDVCAGVGCAHQAGIVHRDLKPANVMLTQCGQIKVLGFGIVNLPAPLPQTRSGTQPMLAAQPQADRALGTAGYLSPEQANGRAVDARSDVFSIGVMLYEMLSGRRAFSGNSHLEISPSTAQDQPLPISIPNPRVSQALAALVASCLSKDPAQRPASATALQQQIEQQLASYASGAAAQPAFAQAAMPNQPEAATTHVAVAGTLPAANGQSGSRLPLLLGLGAAVTLCLVLAGAGVFAAVTMSGHFDEAPPETSNRQGAARLREPEAGLNALTQYQNPDDSSVSTLSAAAWATATKDFREAASQHGAPKRWHAAADFSEGQRLLSLGRLEQARGAFERSRQLDPEFALPWLGLSSTELRLRKYDAALDAAQKAQVLAPRLWPAVTAAARAYAHASKLDFAIQEYRRALVMAPDKPYLLSELALTYHAAGMDDDAERYAEKALALDADLVPALVLLAERALETGAGQRALEYSRRATGVEPREVSAWLAQGDALLLLDRKNEAREAWRTALRLWRETRQRGAPDARLKQVEAALDQNQLPPPRNAPAARGGSGAGRSQAADRSVPEARSKPRSKPPAKRAPVRSLPAPAPEPLRSRPRGLDEEF